MQTREYFSLMNDEAAIAASKGYPNGRILRIVTGNAYQDYEVSDVDSGTSVTMADGKFANKINPIGSGSGGGAVDSVNGHTGTVVLTADDVGAMDSVPVIVPDVDALFTQNKHVIDYTNSSVPGLAGQRALLHIQNGKGGFQLAARGVGSEIHVRAANSSDGTIYPWERLYTTGYKPTSSDIGAEPRLNADQKRKITYGTAAPSGGRDGDIYIQYT